MANHKVIPFPVVPPTAASPETDCHNRVIVRLGRQRIALDIACHATVLKDDAAPLDSNGIGNNDEAPKA